MLKWLKSIIRDMELKYNGAIDAKGNTEQSRIYL